MTTRHVLELDCIIRRGLSQAHCRTTRSAAMPLPFLLPATAAFLPLNLPAVCAYRATSVLLTTDNDAQCPPRTMTNKVDTTICDAHWAKGWTKLLHFCSPKRTWHRWCAGLFAANLAMRTACSG